MPDITLRTYCPNGGCGSGNIETWTDARSNWFHCKACGMSECEQKPKPTPAPSPTEATDA